MAHSPAPWKWDNDELRDRDDRLIFWLPNDPDGKIKVDYDAALIAAAPELLDACKTVLKGMEFWHGKRIPINHHEGYIISFTDEIALLESVIAKAQPNELPAQIPPKPER